MKNLSRCLGLLLAGLALGPVGAQNSPYTYVEGGRVVYVYAHGPTADIPSLYRDPEYFLRDATGPVTVQGSIPNGSISSTARFGALKSYFTAKSQDQTWLRNLGGGLYDNPILLGNVGVTGTAQATASDVIVPHQSGRFSNLYSFGRNRQIDFGFDSNLVRDVLAANAANPNFSGSLYAGIYIEASFSVRLFDMDTSFQEVAKLNVSDYVKIDSTITGPNPQEELTSARDARTIIDRYEGGILVGHSEIATVRDNYLVEVSGPLNYSFEENLIAGHHYWLLFQAACAANVWGVFAFSDGASATCDASHSTYYNGITAAFDPDGNPIPVASLGLDSESGFDYRYASPLSPNPAAVSEVDESAVWQLMLASLGSLWLLRHRSRNPIALRKGHALVTLAG